LVYAWDINRLFLFTDAIYSQIALAPPAQVLNGFGVPDSIQSTQPLMTTIPPNRVSIN
jgi:hypothetical protein